MNRARRAALEQERSLGSGVGGNHTMKNQLAALVGALSVLFVMSASAIAQTGNGTLTGIVEDPQKALIPGVSITATNTETGVTTSVVSNESGAYNIPTL